MVDLYGINAVEYTLRPAQTTGLNWIPWRFIEYNAKCHPPPRNKALLGDH